jgi:hypothetical protein
VNDKSHVSMEQHACKVCCRTYDKGAILLDKRLRQSLDRHTVTGWGLCPEHAQRFEDGFIALVEIDPARSTLSPDGTYRPQNAWRTGKTILLKREIAAQVFDKAIPDGLPLMWIDAEAFRAIEAMSQPESET